MMIAIARRDGVPRLQARSTLVEWQPGRALDQHVHLDLSYAQGFSAAVPVSSEARVSDGSGTRFFSMRRKEFMLLDQRATMAQNNRVGVGARDIVEARDVADGVEEPNLEKENRFAPPRAHL